MSSNKFNYLEIIEYLNSEKIKVSVFGTFGSGKTTFLNALINENILTAAYEPTTAVPTRIRYEKSFNILIHLLSDKTLKLYSDDSEDGAWRRYIGRSGGSNILGLLKKKESQIQEFLRKWTKEGERAQEVKEVVVELPLDWLKGKIELIDTPGIDNEFFKHKELTESIASETDIAIMLIDGRQGSIKKTEFIFFNKINRVVKDSVAAITFLDRKDPKEREDILDYIKNDQIPKNWENPILPNVHGISALLQLEDCDAEDKKSLKKNFKDFLSNIKNRIEKKRGNILLERLGNPHKKIYVQAKKLEKSSADRDLSLAIQKYDELKDILIAAKLNPKPAEDGGIRCDERFKEKLNIIKSIKDQFKLLDKNNMSNENYLKKIKKINKSLIDYEENDDEIQAEIKSVEKKIKKTKDDKKLIKDYIDSAKKLVKEEKKYESIEQSKNAFESAKKLMVKYDLDTADIKKEIKRCNNILNRFMDRINNYVDKYKKLSHTISVFERYEKVQKIYIALQNLDAYKTSAAKSVELIYKDYNKLQKKAEIANESNIRILALIAIIEKELATINKEEVLSKKWSLIPNLFVCYNEIDSLMKSALLDEDQSKNLEKIKNKLEKINNSELKNLSTTIQSIGSMSSLYEMQDSYKEMNSILLTLNKKYSDLDEYKKILDAPYKGVKSSIRKIEKDLSAFTQLADNFNKWKKSCANALKRNNYKVVIKNLDQIDDALLSYQNDNKIKSYSEFEDIIKATKDWKKKIIIEIEKTVNDVIDNLKTTNGKKVLALEKKRLEGITSYLKKKHDIIIDLNVITELGKSIYRKNFKWAVIIAAPISIFFIILSIVNEGDLTISFSGQNTSVNKYKKPPLSRFNEAEFNNALRFNLFEKAELLVNKARPRWKRNQYYARLINACIDNNQLSRAATIFYTNAVSLSATEIRRLGMAFVYSNYFSQAERLFEHTNSQMLGISMAEYYINSSWVKMEIKGIIQKRRVHTDKSFQLMNRAKGIIKNISSRRDVNRLNILINKLENN